MVVSAKLRREAGLVAIGIGVGVSLSLAAMVLTSKQDASPEIAPPANAVPAAVLPPKKGAEPVAVPALEVPAVADNKAATEAPANARRVDLLKLVNPQKNTVMGNWTLTDNGLIGKATKAGQPLIEIPYVPPQEYDYEVTFTRTSGRDTLDLVCAAGGRQFSFTVGGWVNTIVAFGMVDGKEGRDNDSAKVSPSWITNRQKYTALVKVRKNGVEGYLDGQLITRHATNDFSEMSVYSWNALPNPQTVGLCVGPGTTIVIESAQIIEVTGEGKMLQ